MRATIINLLAILASSTLLVQAGTPVLRKRATCSIGFYYENGCKQCDKGYKCVGNDTRTQCTPGTYQPSKGQSTCINCDAGTYQSQSGAQSCTTCQSGHYCPSAAATQTDCGSGNYAPSAQPTCTPCPPGSYCNSNNESKPKYCSPGYFRKDPGGKQMCDPCPSGSFSNIYGATSCCLCCSGYYNDQVAQPNCQQCPNRGTFQRGYSTPGATAAANCVASAGAVQTCTQLPAGSADSPAPSSAQTCPATASSTATMNRRSAPTGCRQQGFKRCPTPWSDWRKAGTECVDIMNDLESCGGCVLDSDDGHASADGGRDCSAIPGVDRVRCVKGGCQIATCRKGWRKSLDGQTCIEQLNPLKQISNKFSFSNGYRSNSL